MNTILEKLSQDLVKQGVFFEPHNQRVRCLAHIINLAAKKALESLRASAFENVNEILECDDTIDNLDNITYKVNYRF